MMDRSTLTLDFALNGASSRCRAPADARLVEILRDQFGLTSPRAACDIGRCGACMVLSSGQPVNSCLLMAWQLDGADIVTAEGIDASREGRVVKAALTAENAFQCGYCAPGFVVTLTALFTRTPVADETQIRRALEGNICRCTGYHSIMRGALRAGEMLAGSAGETA
jgi:carbon-monoxide dehydrogenase small subunit